MKTVLETEEYQYTHLSFNFVDREQMLSLNQSHLSHDYDTDILTFDYSHNEKLHTEFFISLWAIEDSSQLYNTTNIKELQRLIIHGLLHCVGYNDKTDGDRTAMREREDLHLNLFHVKHLKNV